MKFEDLSLISIFYGIVLILEKKIESKKIKRKEK
jgi:hypothetical protein